MSDWPSSEGRNVTVLTCGEPCSAAALFIDGRPSRSAEDFLVVSFTGAIFLDCVCLAALSWCRVVEEDGGLFEWDGGGKE